MSGANARSRKRHGGFPRLLENSRPSATDPIVAVRSAAFGARNLPFIHFHPTAKSGPSAEEVIREIKRLFKIEKNPPTVTRAEGRLTRRGGFLKSTASSPTTITAHNGCGSL